MYSPIKPFSKYSTMFQLSLHPFSLDLVTKLTNLPKKCYLDKAGFFFFAKFNIFFFLAFEVFLLPVQLSVPIWPFEIWHANLVREMSEMRVWEKFDQKLGKFGAIIEIGKTKIKTLKNGKNLNFLKMKK